MNESRDINAIYCVIMELNSTYLEKNNKHVNLDDSIVSLIKERIPMREKTYILMNYNLLVLNKYITTLCKEGFSNFSEMEMLMLLLNHCDEELVKKILINYLNDDPYVCFGHVVSVG